MNKLSEIQDVNLVKGWSLAPEQVDGVRFGLSKKYAVFNLQTGLGKCLGLNTPVFMFDGTIKMVQDILVGDQLMGPDSTPRNVLSLARGRAPLYRVHQIKGDDYVVNDDHILSLKMSNPGKAYPNAPYDPNEIVNISVKDYLKQNKSWQHRAKGWRVGLDYSTQEVPIHPYLFGLWLGDGCSRNSTVYAEERLIVEALYHHADEMGLSLVKIEDPERFTGYRFTGGGTRVNKFRSYLQSEGLMLNKHIPEDYLVNDRASRLELLAGLVDTDGNLSCSSSLDFTFKSKVLADGLVTLCRSLGYYSTVLPCQKTCTNAVGGPKTGDYYRVKIVGDLSEIPSRLSRKIAPPRLINKRHDVTGIQLEPLGEGDYYGFELDGDRLFLLGDLTVTHNTFMGLTLVHHILNNYPNRFKIVVLCPAEANDAWRKELIHKFKTQYCIYEATGKEGSYSADVHIFNFSSMKKYLYEIEQLARTHKIVAIIDEAHALQHRDSAQYETFATLRKHFSICYALTATPLMSVGNIQGLWNLIDYLAPGYLGNWGQFKHNFLEVQLNKIRARGRSIRVEEIIGIKNTVKLKELLDNILIVRSIKYDIRYHYYSADLTPEEKTFYLQAGKGVLAGSEREEFTSRLHDLQQVVDWSHKTIPGSVRSKLSSKDKLFAQVLRNLLRDGMSVLVYAEYHSTISRLESIIKALQAKGIIDYSNLFRITGKESKETRSLVENALEPRSIVLCTQAGTQSRNLQKANQVITYNIPFSIGRFIQLIGRVARMDSTFDHQDIHIIEASSTVDTYKRILLQDNSWILQELFGENQSLPDVSKLDRTFVKDLRRKLLWSFSPGKKTPLIDVDTSPDISFD